MDLSLLRQTAILRGFGLFKIPMIFFLSPSVVENSETRCVLKIPLTRRSRNHLGSMYFGALAVGADCAGGFVAWQEIQKQKSKISLVFKDFKAEFLKRPLGDVTFTCEQSVEIREFVRRVAQSDERENFTVRITAAVPTESGSEPVALFDLTLSLKRKS